MLFALGIFCATAAHQLHRLLGQPTGMPAISALGADYLLPGIIALWFVRDAHEHGRKTIYDFGSFLFFLWPVMAPIYLFQTRGLRAFSTIGLFFVVFFSSIAFAMFMGYPWSFPR